MDNKDYVAQVMDDWYSSMAANNVSVQPKASTLLGMVLANYDIKPKHDVRDIWDEYLIISGGQFKGWYDSLTEEQREEWHTQIKSFQTKRKTNKALLKG